MHILKLLLKIGGWGFIGIAVINLTITFFIYRHERNFVQSATRAQGTITKMVERTDGSHDTVYYPVFTFQDVKGQQQEIYSSSGQYPPAYRVGDTVNVLYNPDTPTGAEIDGFFNLWFLSVLFGFFGVFEMFFGIGCFAVVFIIRKYEQKTTAARTV